jgi:hypothetical protein
MCHRCAASASLTGEVPETLVVFADYMISCEANSHCMMSAIFTLRLVHDKVMRQKWDVKGTTKRCNFSRQKWDVKGTTKRCNFSRQKWDVKGTTKRCNFSSLILAADLMDITLNILSPYLLDHLELVTLWMCADAY